MKYLLLLLLLSSCTLFRTHQEDQISCVEDLIKRGTDPIDAGRICDNIFRPWHQTSKRICNPNQKCDLK